MAIFLRLDDLMAEKKVTVTELAKAADISRVNMSRLKSGKIKAIRMTTLNAICEYLECEPGDILKFEKSASTGKPADADSPNLPAGV